MAGVASVKFFVPYVGGFAFWRAEVSRGLELSKCPTETVESGIFMSGIAFELSSDNLFHSL